VTGHVIWDWNGTLLDDVQACVDAINRMLARRSLPMTDTVRYRDIFGFPVRGYYAELGFDLAAEDWDGMAREFHADYAETARPAALRNGARAALAALRAAGTPMSILSACELGILRRMVAERGVDAFFDHIFGLGDLYAASKVELGRRMLRDTGVDPAKVLLVGDTVHDYEVAQALGCRAVLMAGGHQSAARLRACGCPVLEGFEAVVAAVGHDRGSKAI
jgi:phosphoglycolate phosphatase